MAVVLQINIVVNSASTGRIAEEIGNTAIAQGFKSYIAYGLGDRPSQSELITIEASNIYFRGGFVLLEQLLDYCEVNSLDSKVYIGFKEVIDYLSKKEYKYISIIPTNGFQTLIRYCRRRSRVLFFCNLPPFFRNKRSVLYAHNILFFKSPKPLRGETAVFNLKKFIYFYWIKLFARKVDVVACQTKAVQKSLKENMGVRAELYPFYKDAQPLQVEKIYDFCYVGSGVNHKNNLRLLEAVENLSAKYAFRLVMTIEDSPQNKVLMERMAFINNKFSREIVVNMGLLPPGRIGEVYSASNALVFPSKAETIALPLIEALQHGLKVLSSDLPFTHQVVENPIVFNPKSVEDIIRVMENQLNGGYDNIRQGNRIPNRLSELIDLLYK